MATFLKIDDTLKSRVNRLASQRRRSPDWIMLEAIREYVGREEAQDQMTRGAVAAWEAYQKDGLHLTLDEVSAWLDTWGTEDEGPPPPCHK